MFAPAGTSFASILSAPKAEEKLPEEQESSELSLLLQSAPAEVVRAVTPAPAEMIMPANDAHDAVVEEEADAEPALCIPQPFHAKPKRKRFAAPMASTGANPITPHKPALGASQRPKPRVVSASLKRKPSVERDEDDDDEGDADETDTGLLPPKRMIIAATGVPGGAPMRGKYKSPFATGSANAGVYGSVGDVRQPGSSQGRTARPAVPSKRFSPEQEGAILLHAPDADQDERAVIVEPIVGSKLRDHQIEGVRFIYDALTGKSDSQCHGCILADDMGLGKTYQTIASARTATPTHSRAAPHVLRSL